MDVNFIIIGDIIQQRVELRRDAGTLVRACALHTTYKFIPQVTGILWHANVNVTLVKSASP